MRRRAPGSSAAACTSPTPPRSCACRGGEVLTTDGPFAETKEHLGGFCIIEADGPRRGARLGGEGPAPCIGRPDRGPPVPGRARGLSGWSVPTPRPARRAEIGRIFRAGVRPVRWPPWSASSATSTSPRRRSRRRSPSPCAVAGRRPAAQPRRLDHHHRPQPGHRPPAPRGARTGTASAGAALTPHQPTRHAARRWDPCATTGCG